MRWPFGPPHLTLKPSKKKNTKGHLTWPLNPPTKNTKKKKKQTNKKPKKKNKKKKREAPPKKTAKTPKNSFSIISQIFPFFGWLLKISFFWHLGPESAHAKNTIKIGVSGPFFGGGKQMCVTETAIFGPKNPKFINFSYHFFFPIFFSFKNKKHKNQLKPLFL